MNRSPLRAFFLIPLVLASFALSPAARAVCQEGCLTNQNTVLGDDALLNNTATDNTAIGFEALYTNTIGSNNTAVGSNALFGNTNGRSNTATGDYALWSNTEGNYNTAIGDQALLNNTTGYVNTATGALALNSNTTGNYNTATGYQALLMNTTGTDDTATGSGALYSNTTGSGNTAIGGGALFYNTTGINNTAIGTSALGGNEQNFNTAIGYGALSNSHGSNNIAVGYRAGSNLNAGNHNIDIDSNGFRGDAATIRIGSLQTNTYIAGVSGVTVAGGVGVIVDSSGHLGTVVSSARFKQAIKPMDKASEAILSLHPVTFRYKHELDPAGIPQFGLVAEQVEKVNPDLVTRDDEGKPYTVRYEAVNAMLLNEFLKEHRTVQEQQATITELKSTVAQQQQDMKVFAATLKEQASQIQKVSAQLELSKPAPQMVGNNQ